MMSKEGMNPPFVLFVNPSRYSRLIAVHERTGLTKLQGLKALVSEVVQLNQLDDERALLISANSYVIEVAVGSDTTVDYIGPEDGKHLFRGWETVAPRIKCPKSVMLLEEA